MMLYILIILTISVLANSVRDEYLIVKTSLGYVRGIKSTSRNDKKYTRFIGIQYGTVKIRFQEAEAEVRNWEGVKDAIEFGSICPQMNTYAGGGAQDENCLFLNIYVPDGGKQVKPVIFYVHGGAFKSGSGRYFGKKYFMDEDIILITINYRLNAFGFLAVNDNARASGNMGFRDQLLALKWVRNEIARFGGDPEQVTLMGGSAGAGMFHAAILHSGAVLNPWTWRPIKDAEQVAFELGEKLGCDTTTSDTLLDCLTEADVETILSAQSSLWKFYMDPIIPFIPVVDNTNPSAFLPSNPVQIIREGKFHRVPTIFTMCADEGLFIHAASIIKSDQHIKALDENWVTNGGIQALLDEDARLPKLSSAQKQQIMSSVRDHYFGQRKLEANDEWTMRRLSEFYGDRYFLHGIRETALTMSKYTPVYAGLFTDVGADSVIRIFGYNRSLGVSHVDDLQFFFNEFGVGPFTLSPKLAKYSNDLIKLWTNFVQTGVPRTSILGIEFIWPQVGAEDQAPKESIWVDLGNIPTTIRDPFADRLKIWDQVYKLFGEENVRDEL